MAKLKLGNRVNIDSLREALSFLANEEGRIFKEFLVNKNYSYIVDLKLDKPTMPRRLASGTVLMYALHSSKIYKIDTYLAVRRNKSGEYEIVLDAHEARHYYGGKPFRFQEGDNIRLVYNSVLEAFMDEVILKIFEEDLYDPEKNMQLELPFDSDKSEEEKNYKIILNDKGIYHLSEQEYFGLINSLGKEFRESVIQPTNIE